jgi:hypothetical protein
MATRLNKIALLDFVFESVSSHHFDFMDAGVAQLARAADL